MYCDLFETYGGGVWGKTGYNEVVEFKYAISFWQFSQLQGNENRQTCGVITKNLWMWLNV